MSSSLVTRTIYVQPTIGRRGYHKTILLRVGEDERGENQNVRQTIDASILRRVKETVPRPSERVDSDGINESRGTGKSNSRSRLSLRYASNDKVYESDGYKLGRWANTVIPENNYISESTAKYINQAQKDFINLGMENFEAGNKSILNFDGTGTGKTRQELGLAKTYLEKNPNAKVLIVTESESIIDNAFLSDAQTMQIPINKIKSDSAKEGSINVATYTNLEKVGKEYDLIIFDEAHNMKNADSNKAVRGVELLTLAKNTALFTATPLDKADHLHYITSALNLNFKDVMDQIGVEVREIKAFDGNIKNYYTPKPGLTTVNVADNIEKLFNTITDRGLAVKREVSLSNLKMQIDTIQMSEDKQRIVDKAYSEYLNLVESIENPLVRGRIKATSLMKLRGLLESVKIQETIDRTIRSIENGEQVVIVGSRVNDAEFSIGDGGEKYIAEGLLQAVADGLQARGIPVVDYFGTKKDKNGVKNFQDGKVNVFITTPQSGGTGISLDDSKGGKPRRMLITSFPFSANSFVQIIGRINRKNTKSVANVEAIYVDHPIDNWNKSIIGTKLSTLSASVMGDYAKIDSNTLAMVESVESEDVAQAIIQNNSDLPKPKVSTNDKPVLDMARMQRPSNVSEPKQKGAIATYKSMGEYIKTVPVTGQGLPSTNLMWKDAKIQLGTEKILISELIRTKPQVALHYIKRSLSSKAQEKVDKGEFTVDSLSKIRFAGSVTPKERLKTESLTKSIINEGIDFLYEYLSDEDDETLFKAIQNANLVKRQVIDKNGNRVSRWVNPTADINLPVGFKTVQEQREEAHKKGSVFFSRSSHFGNVPEVAQPNERKKLMQIEKTLNSEGLSQEQKDQALEQANKYIQKINEAHSEFKKDGFYISADLRFKIMRRPNEGKEITLSGQSLDTLLKFGKIGIISAGRNPEIKEDMELSDSQIAERDKQLVNDLKIMGFQFVKGMGKYGGLPEESYIFFLPEAKKTEVTALGTKYNQDSVIYTDKGNNEMIFTTGKYKGKAYRGKSFDRVSDKQDDFFTEVKTPKRNFKFSLRFNFDNKE